MTLCRNGESSPSASLFKFVRSIESVTHARCRAASAEVVKRIQGSEDGAYGALTDDADRALTVVQNKLDPKLSVEYTVNQLIQEATDVNNLAMIFEGTLAARALMMERTH